MEQNQRREDISIDCSTTFNCNKANFSRRFITMDGTWFYSLKLETKEQSKQWTEKEELHVR